MGDLRPGAAVPHSLLAETWIDFRNWGGLCKMLWAHHEGPSGEQGAADCDNWGPLFNSRQRSSKTRASLVTTKTVRRTQTTRPNKCCSPWREIWRASKEECFNVWQDRSTNSSGKPRILLSSRRYLLVGRPGYELLLKKTAQQMAWKCRHWQFNVHSGRALV